jgi:hypothetical protein
VKSILGSKQLCFVITAIVFLSLTGCAASEPRPDGVSRFISFSVTPLYPKSYEIVVGSLHSIYGHFGVEELKAAWERKALLVANGRKFKVSPLLVRDHETDLGGMPEKSRSVSGTITLID